MSLERKKLGRTNIEVTELCLGTLIYGALQADMSSEEGARAIRRGLELGINFIDTAKIYKTYDHVRLGIQGFDDVVIASKSQVKSASEMREDVETCLREIQREPIDIFILHCVRNNEDMKKREGALDTLVKCRREGKIRAIGLSSHGIAGTRCSLEYDEIDVVFPIMNRKGLGITDGTHEEMLSLIREIHATGRGLYAMKPLGGGHLIDDIPSSIEYLQELHLFDSISVGLKTPEEVEVMVGVFEKDPASYDRALEMGNDRSNRKHLIVYHNICEQCGACVSSCAQEAIILGDNGIRTDQERCILCGYCAEACPKFAIRVI